MPETANNLRRKSRKLRISTVQMLALGFAAMIAVGTGLLALPCVSAAGKSIGLLKAFFTATSAVCVNGLTVTETGTSFTLFGQIIILILVQIGGLGFVSIMTIISVVLGRRITLRERMLIQDAMNENNIGGMVGLIVWVIKLTFICELAGAALLSIAFIRDFGAAKGIYYAVFHSVSAFCNAGFDVLGEGASITGYSQDPLVVLTISALIIAGGLGFGVWNDVFRARRFSKMRLHTKLVLTVTAMLLVLGTAATLALEWDNPATLGNMSVPDKLLNSFFQSVTLRTAGFFTMPQLMLEPATKFMGTVLMFIGAAPASTGGGMKITTVAVLTLLAVSIMRGKKETAIFGRAVAQDVLRRAMAVFMIGLFAMATGTIVISALHPEMALIDVLYESVSALCSVGITAAGTSHFCTAAQLIIIVMMYMGRIGPLTLTLAVAYRQQNQSASIKLPEDKVIIG